MTWDTDRDVVTRAHLSRKDKPKRSLLRRVWASVCAFIGVDGDNIFSVRKK